MLVGRYLSAKRQSNITGTTDAFIKQQMQNRSSVKRALLDTENRLSKIVPANTSTEPNHDLISELKKNNIKVTAHGIVGIGRTKDGKIVFLEIGKDIPGRSPSGLTHIMTRHEKDFGHIGVRPEQIVDVVMRAATNGQLVGHIKTTNVTPRQVFEIEHDGAKKLIAVQIGSNGYIVGANPTSIEKVIFY